MVARVASRTRDSLIPSLPPTVVIGAVSCTIAFSTRSDRINISYVKFKLANLQEGGKGTGIGCDGCIFGVLEHARDRSGGPGRFASSLFA